MLTQQRLKQKLKYDATTGVFTRLDGTYEVAGCIGPDGYRVISVDGSLYPAAKLAWLYATGEYPSGIVDHINLDRADDRLVNLRLATRSQNAANTGKYSNNTTGYKGVVRIKGGKWVAQLRVDGRRVLYSRHATVEEAAEAYATAVSLHYGKYGRVTTTE